MKCSITVSTASIDSTSISGRITSLWPVKQVTLHSTTTLSFLSNYLSGVRLVVRNPDLHPYNYITWIFVAVVHLKVLTLGCMSHICRLQYFTRKYWPLAPWAALDVLGVSLGSTHPWLFMSRIHCCRRNNLSQSWIIWKHSSSYGLCNRHSLSGGFMALPYPFVKVVERAFRIDVNICLSERIEAPTTLHCYRTWRKKRRGWLHYIGCMTLCNRGRKIGFSVSRLTSRLTSQIFSKNNKSTVVIVYIH